MTTNDSPVTEDELHAYVDGELPADRARPLSPGSRHTRTQAALVAAWRAQAEAIRARYGARRRRAGAEAAQARNADAHRPFIEPALDRRGRRRFACRVPDRRRHRLDRARRRDAAVPGGFETVTADALEAYKLYVVEVRHPVEVPGDERAHMTQWLSKRLGYALNVPDLQSIGLKLVGGRLLPGPTGEAARSTCMRARPASASRIYCAKATAPETALRYRDARPCRRLLLGGRQGRLCGERPGRPRPARAGHQGGLRADRQDRRAQVLRLFCLAARLSPGPCADRRACRRAICASVP